MPVARDEFDIGPLSWVKPEIELALRRADEGIRRFSVSPDDQELARSTLAHLHQVSGALLMVGLEPVARVSEALEKQIELLARGDLTSTPELMGAIRGAISALSQYLEGLMRGDPNRPLALFPVYKAVLAESGTESATEVDLFYPDLSRRPKFSENASSRVTGAELTALLNLKRAEFQRGLLGLLRSKDYKQSLQLMRNALATIEATQTAGARMLWWIAIGLVDGLANASTPPDTPHKQLCGRVDQQIKRQADGADTVSERLIRELLFAIAKMPPTSTRVREIQETYNLTALLPPAAKENPEDTRAKHALRELKEQLEHIKETWLKFTSGNRASLTQFVEETSRLTVLSQGFHNEALQAVFEKLGEVASNLQANPREPGEALSLETATALLMAKDAVDNYSRLGPEFKSLAETAVVRVAAALKGQSLPVEGASQLADISRAAQERMLFFQLGQEVLANLNQIEQTLDAYFRDPTKRSNLASLPGFINQVLGAFSMLESEDAVNLLKASRDLVQRFIDADGAADPRDAELTAEAFSNLGLYVSALQQHRENADELLHPVLARFNITPSKPAVQEPEVVEEEISLPRSTEEDVENRKRGIADLYELWRREPQATAYRSALVDALVALCNEAQSIDRTDIVDQASRLRGIVADNSNQPGPILREAFVALLGADLVREPEPPVEPQPQAQQATKPVGVVEPAATEIDAELLEIFLEEATEVLGGIAIHRDVILANPSDREAMTVIRRGFHTLKGSGRMVGLTELGEVAWQVEQVMNKWLRDEKPASQGLLRLISDTHRSFVGWIEILQSGGNPRIAAEAIFRLADQLKNDQEPTEEEDASTNAVEEAVEPVTTEEAIRDVEPALAISLEPETTMESTPELPPKVVVGDITLDPDFFEIFANEAKVHMATLRRELAALNADPEQHVTHDFMRAAHTLTGICRTCGFAPIAELGFRLEKWLLDRLDHPAPFIDEDLSLTAAAVEDVDRMVSSILENRQFPMLSPLTERLVERLNQVRADREQEVKTALAEDAEALRVITGSPTIDVSQQSQPQEAESLLPEGDLADLDTELSAPINAELPESAEVELQHSIEQELSALIDIQPTDLGSIEINEETVAVDVPDLAPAEPIEVVHQEMADAEPSLEFESESLGPEPISLPQPPKAPTDSVVTKTSVQAPTATHITTPVTPATKTLEQSENADAGKERRVIVDDVDEQLLPVFLEEAFDLLPEVGESLRVWRSSPDDKAATALLGRHLHTLKGSARMAGVMRLGELAHVLENRVISMQSQAQPEEADFDALEEGFDRFNVALERLKGGERADLLLTTVMSEPVAVDAPTAVAAHAKVINATAATTAVPAPAVQGEEAADRRAMLRVRADLVDRFVNDAGEISIARSRIEGEMGSFRQGLAELIENVNRLRAQLREIEIQAESQIQSSIDLQQEVGDQFDPLEFDRFTRMQELTRFMAESVHDFVTLQQSLIKNLDEADAALAAQSRLNRDLQQDLMSVRMVPLGNLGDRFYRVVRQTAKELGKKANLELKGMRTELDRSVLEQIVAPFEHLLRNALSHGVELPDVREAAGKSATGEITIDARQQGNEIVLTFSDDGGGINTERVRQKAIEQGLLSANDYPDQKALIDFIFMPGFSTASEVTQVAGRGVGMDVVKNAIVNLGGRVEVETELGRGTKFIITLPLTLAVTQVLLIRANGTLYAIPAAMVELVQQWKVADVTALREKKEVVWQGNQYPFSSLTHMLGEEEKVGEPRRYFPVLLLRSGAHRAAVEVDSIEGNREIVVKSIGPQLSRLTGISGATVLGNGQVVLILNPVMLAGRQEGPGGDQHVPQRQEPVARAPLVMVVDDSLTVRKITSRLLLREGYQVVTAKDGVDALQQLQEFIPDVMLLDIEMPRMDGFELTRNIRADARTAGIPIIMITSRTAEKHRNFALELGVNEYLGKPFQEEELLGHIVRFTARESSLTS